MGQRNTITRGTDVLYTSGMRCSILWNGVNPLGQYVVRLIILMGMQRGAHVPHEAVPDIILFSFKYLSCCACCVYTF